MGCFTDFIAVRTECGPSVTATSGLYINDLPGISIKTAGEFTSQYKGGYELLTAAIDQGINETKAKAFSYIDKHIKAVPFLEIDGAGMWSNRGTTAIDYDDTTTGTGGVEICLPQIRGANMRKVFISTIEVLTNTTTAGKTLNIKDRNTTTPKSVDLTAGEVSTIDVYQQFESDKVYINWDLSDIDPNDSHLGVGNCSTCNSVNWKGYQDFKYAWVRGRNDDTTGKSNTYGIRVNFKIQCDREKVLCMLREELKYIIWKECGVRVLKAFLSDSTRFNAVAMTRQDEIERALNDLSIELYGDQGESGLKVGNRAYKGLWHEFGQNAALVLTKYDNECIRCNRSKWGIQRP